MTKLSRAGARLGSQMNGEYYTPQVITDGDEHIIQRLAYKLETVSYLQPVAEL